MSLFSLFKKKQETSSDPDNGEFRSRAEGDTKAARSRNSSKRGDGSKKNQADDPMLPEKKRARRRLIGAVALVLAAVIGLPMVLDSEPKPLADDVNIQIPSKDKPLSGGAANNEAKKEAKNDTLAAASVEQAASRADSKPVNAGKALEPKEEIVDPATLTPNKNKAASREPVTPAVVATAIPTNKTAAHPEKESKVEHKAEAKPEVKAEVKPEIKLPKSTEKNSASIVAAVSESKTAAPKPAGKPAESADEAARAMAILEGKSPAKAAGKPAGENAKADKSSSAFVVQVAALASQEKVDELQGKLKSAGIKSYTQKVATTSGEKIRIRVGPFESREDADKMHAKLAKLGLNGTLVPN
ncbi:MAG: SPOR domain-containing protein [Pseudomonadota bacterium]